MAIFAHPLTPLIGLSLASGVMLCAYAWAGANPSAGAELLLSLGWACMIVLWMRADARKLRRSLCYDFGFLALLFYPISLVWYCLWSRGWRGLLILLLLLALLLVPIFVFAVVWVARAVLLNQF